MLSSTGHVDAAKLRPPPSKTKLEFDPELFLATIGEGRRVLRFSPKHTIFIQGTDCDAVFYIQTGKVKLTVVAKTGKEATIGILNS
jgi:CRP/FNR family cyclic AMP-dependent transcriptional regulator